LHHSIPPDRRLDPANTNPQITYSIISYFTLNVAFKSRRNDTVKAQTNNIPPISKTYF
jgi:hypothetical protein